MTDDETLAAQYYGFLKTASIGAIAERPGILSWNGVFDEHFISSPPPAHWLSADTNILGKRMERFMHWHIAQSRKFEVLQESLQIKDGSITIGELDFLLCERETKQLVHLEMAYKLYLLNPNASDQSEKWIGPNFSDSLDKKLRKLIQKQFALIYSSPAKEQLASLGHHFDKIKQALCFKSQLFLPFGMDTIPDDINPEAHVGHWIRRNQLHEFAGYQFYLPHKINWSIEPEQWNHWQSLENALKSIDTRLAKNHSPLCWLRDSFGNCSRMFVVWW